MRPHVAPAHSRLRWATRACSGFRYTRACGGARAMQNRKAMACQWTCPECGYLVQASTEKVLKSNSRRHTREEHGDISIKTRRKQLQASRLRASRELVVDAEVVGKVNAKAYITCPVHRDALYDLAMKECLRIGFQPSQVARRKGLDFTKYTQTDPGRMRNVSGTIHVPKGLKKDTFLMWDFHINFLPMVAGAFALDSTLDVVFWLEDDIAFSKDVLATTLTRHATAMSNSLGWMAYTKVKGEARYGTHCIAVPRYGVALARQALDEDAAAAAVGGDPLSYLEGLDTFIWRACRRKLGGAPLAMAAEESMAGQRKHKYAGRK